MGVGVGVGVCGVCSPSILRVNHHLQCSVQLPARTTESRRSLSFIPASSTAVLRTVDRMQTHTCFVDCSTRQKQHHGVASLIHSSDPTTIASVCSGTDKLLDKLYHRGTSLSLCRGVREGRVMPPMPREHVWNRRSLLFEPS